MSEKPLTGPYARLLEQVVEYVRGEMEYLPDDAIGDSPIEKILHTALIAHMRFTDCSYSRIDIPSKERPLTTLLASCGPSTLILHPQAQLDGWRVDFMAYAWDHGRVSGRAQWRRLILECDGHDFHERTKEQAAKDRGRDREFQMRGFTVLRFTGSELHRDPLGCARQVSEWMEMGW